MKCQNGSGVLVGILIGLFLAGILFTTYYLGMHNIFTPSVNLSSVSPYPTISPFSSPKESSSSAMNRIPSPTTTTTASSFDSEISGFPIYPGSKFIGKQTNSPCPSDKQSGFSTCSSTIYTWQTGDDFNAVNSFFSQDKSQSVWTCSGGAGSIVSAREADIKTSCTNKILRYDLEINASAQDTQIILIIRP